MFKKLAVFGGVTIAIAMGVFGGNLLYRQYLKAESEKAEIAKLNESKLRLAQEEAKYFVGLTATLQHFNYITNKKFVSFQELSGSSVNPPDSENYTYKINLINDQNFQIIGIPKKENLKLYTFAALIGGDRLYSKLCESGSPTKNEPPRMDTLNGNEIPCPEGYKTVSDQRSHPQDRYQY